MIEKELPLVNVIVPSYNHEKYIEETIESIVNQTYKNIELIVIDDGSKDNSPKILAELSNKYNFTLIVRDNKGLPATLNEGIKLSKGKYISVCASDDKFALNKIDEQVNFMENNPAYGISYTNVIKFYENGMERHIINKKYQSGYIFNDLLCQYFSIPAGSVLYQKKVFEEVDLFDTSLAIEDFDMFLKISKKFEIGYLNKYLFYYRSHGNNTSNNIEKMEKNVDIILEKWKNDQQYANAIMRKNLFYFRNFASTNKKEALKRLPRNVKILNDKIFFEGLLRLLIPKFIYKKVLRR